MTKPIKSRILSIDVFRGLTIAFMIIVNSPGTWQYVYGPLRHASWHGWTPTDLVFPFFMTTVGLSMALSFSKFNDADKGALIKKISKRAALIFLVGVLLNWFPFFHKNIIEVRVLGVLQRIAMSFFLAGIAVVLLRKSSALLILSSAGLLGYWALLAILGDYTLEGNYNKVFDSYFLPDRNVYGGFGIPFDPEGFLGSITGMCQILLGYVFCKTFILDKTYKIFPWGIIIGILLVIVSYIWDGVFPINKPLWTSSYVLLTSGLAFILCAVLYWIIDIKKLTTWTMPFRVFGLNPLASYVLSGIIVKILLYVFKNESGTGYGYLYTKIFQPIFGNYNGSLAFALFITFLVWVYAFWLYRNNKVIKL